VTTSGPSAKRPSGTTAAKRGLAAEQRRLGEIHAEAVAAAWADYDLAREGVARIRRAAVDLADTNYRESLTEALAVLRPHQDQQPQLADERPPERPVVAQDAPGTIRETVDPNRDLGAFYTPSSVLSPDIERQERTP